MLSLRQHSIVLAVSTSFVVCRLFPANTPIKLRKLLSFRQSSVDLGLTNFHCAAIARQSCCLWRLNFIHPVSEGRWPRVLSRWSRDRQGGGSILRADMVVLKKSVSIIRESLNEVLATPGTYIRSSRTQIFCRNIFRH